MKKIFSIMALALATAMTFTACDDDDTVVVDPTANALKVVSQTTSFGAAQSTGTIVVDATDPVSVTSNAGEWLTTSVSGNTVTVNAEQNNSLEGRTATLTIQAGAKKTDISVIQSGAIFVFGGPEAISVNDNARTLTYSVKANLPVSFTSEADFISTEYNAEEGTVTIKLTKNDTGHMRSSAIIYTCGTINGVIPVKQCDFAKDLAGDYQLVFTDPDDMKLYALAATLKKTGTNYTVEIPAYKFSVPVTFNTSDFSLNWAAGSYIGDYSTYKVVTTIYTTDGYYSWGATRSMTATFDNGFLSNGSRVTLAEFEDNGSYPGRICNTLGFDAYRAIPASSTNHVGYLLLMEDPYLVRVDEAPSAAPSKAPAQMSDCKLEIKTSTKFTPAF